jgi:hypothetical protein
MSRHSVLLASLTATPTSTSDLYDRLGYGTLTQIGLVPYDAFRAELDKLAAAGLARTEAGPDGTTLWRQAPAEGEPGAEAPGSPPG